MTRLKPDVTLEQAEEEVGAIAQRLAESRVDKDDAWTAGIETLQEYAIGGIRNTLYLLMGAVGFVLLFACANVANLLLARAGTREAEVALRSSLGAPWVAVVNEAFSKYLFSNEDPIGKSIYLSFGGWASGITIEDERPRQIVGVVGDVRQLYGVSPSDPLTFAAVTFVLVGVAIVACWIPARWATKLDPNVSLRYE